MRRNFKEDLTPPPDLNQNEPEGRFGRRVGTRLAIRDGARLSDAVAEFLLAQLRPGAFEPGDPLPPERLMAVQFGVSRTVIREAIKALTSRGALVVRPGAGVFVAQVDASVATESLAMLLHASPGLNYEKVHEVREAIEATVAALAAQRATDDDLGAIGRALSAQEAAAAGEAFAVADAAFHLAVAAAAHNDLFGLILEAIGDIMMEVRRHAAYVPGARQRVTSDHRRIAAAIVKRDSVAATLAMRDHISNSRSIVSELDKGLEQSRGAGHQGAVAT